MAMRFIQRFPFALFGLLSSLALACGSRVDDGTVTQNNALSSQATAATCDAGMHPETQCDAKVVSACEQRSVDRCDADSECVVVCYEGTDCPKDALCLANGSKCPIACVPDVVIEPGCYVGPYYLCYDGTTHKETNYDCCFPPGGGGK
jgi:hypothetical protein